MSAPSGGRMARPQYFTLHQLEAWHPCREQVVLFQNVFGSRAQLSTQNLAKAWNAGLDVSWLVQRTLSASARAEYHKIGAAAWAEYDQVRALLARVGAP